MSEYKVSLLLPTRGRTEIDALDKYELDFLLNLVDKNNKDVYTNRVRDKLHTLRHG